jgi:Lon protease-like protein
LRIVPLFPLNTVLFPGMPLDLHIFEPRYQQMVSDCLAQQQPFGVVLIRQGTEALGPLAQTYDVGCLAHIVRIVPLGDGRMNLTAIGGERFRVLDVDDETHSYRLGTIESAPMENPQTLDLLKRARAFAPLVRQYLRSLQLEEMEGVDWEQLELPDEPLVLFHLAAALLQTPPFEKQALLASEQAMEFLERLERLYRREMTLLRHIALSDDGQLPSLWLN